METAGSRNRESMKLTTDDFAAAFQRKSPEKVGPYGMGDEGFGKKPDIVVSSHEGRASIPRPLKAGSTLYRKVRVY